MKPFWHRKKEEAVLWADETPQSSVEPHEAPEAEAEPRLIPTPEIIQSKLESPTAGPKPLPRRAKPFVGRQASPGELLVKRDRILFAKWRNETERSNYSYTFLLGGVDYEVASFVAEKTLERLQDDPSKFLAPEYAEYTQLTSRHEPVQRLMVAFVEATIGALPYSTLHRVSHTAFELRATEHSSKRDEIEATVAYAVERGVPLEFSYTVVRRKAEETHIRRINPVKLYKDGFLGRNVRGLRRFNYDRINSAVAEGKQAATVGQEYMLTVEFKASGTVSLTVSVVGLPDMESRYLRTGKRS